jgi:hypothetical protein
MDFHGKGGAEVDRSEAALLEVVILSVIRVRWCSFGPKAANRSSWFQPEDHSDRVANQVKTHKSPRTQSAPSRDIKRN